MAALGRLSKARHAAVALAAGGTGLLGATGVIGGGRHPERYDTWHVVVDPAGGDALAITTTFDHDFGDADRHGPELFVDNDYGAPTDVSAESPDAPADVSVVDLGSETRIRIGDPDVTVSGQHRYNVSYVLPEARVGTGFLALDILEGDDDLETDHVEVVLTGFELANPRCFAGVAGSTDECEIVRDGQVYRAAFGPLPAGHGVSVDATITGYTDAVNVPGPPLPKRRGGPNRLAGLGLGVLGAAAAVPVYLWARRRGRNEVFAGGAADAAFGDLPSPGAASAAAPATRLVADEDMDELATIEFVPPQGVDPWEARVLLSERFDEPVETFLTGLVGKEAITIDERDGKLVIGSGLGLAAVDDADRQLVQQIFAIADPYTTGAYNPRFAKAWASIEDALAARLSARGWWKGAVPGARTRFGCTGPMFVVVIVMLTIFGGSALGAALGNAFGLLKAWPAAIAFAVIVPAAVAFFMYRSLVPARTAHGSALALRAESFRRFLDASEGKHVEWAWEHGLLREYTAWAVALDEADAWADALAAANVPAPARDVTLAPMLVHRHGSSLRSSRTKPSSSGSRGGRSSFGGGRVGGGGGGVSRGSW